MFLNERYDDYDDNDDDDNDDDDNDDVYMKTVLCARVCAKCILHIKRT